MFGLSRALQVWVHTEPTDMRKSFQTLSALVAEELDREVLSGDLFVFISKDRKRIKVLHFDGTGLIVWAKPPGAGSFRAALSQEAAGRPRAQPERVRALARRKRACRTIWIETAVALALGFGQSDDALRFSL